MSDHAPVPSPAEITAAVHGLEQSRDALLAHCAGLGPDAWHRSDAPGRWTTAQILEHLVIAEQRSLKLLAGMLEQPAEPDWHDRTDAQTAMLPRAAVAEKKFEAPPPLQPQGTAAPDTLLADFAAARAATLAFAVQPGQPLKAHTRNHPAFGPLNGYQWLLLAGYHTQRHLAQMQQAARLV